MTQYSNGLLINLCEPLRPVKYGLCRPMTVLALRSRPDAPLGPAAVDVRVARVEVFEDMTSCEAPWRRLEAIPGLATPYQRYDFL